MQVGCEVYRGAVRGWHTEHYRRKRRGHRDHWGEVRVMWPQPRTPGTQELDGQELILAQRLSASTALPTALPQQSSA